MLEIAVPGAGRIGRIHASDTHAEVETKRRTVLFLPPDPG